MTDVNHRLHNTYPSNNACKVYRAHDEFLHVTERYLCTGERLFGTYLWDEVTL